MRKTSPKQKLQSIRSARKKFKRKLNFKIKKRKQRQGLV